MKKIAIVHPELGFAGPETVAVWMLEALKKEYEVTLITCKSIDLDKINSFFGTTLSKSDIKIDVVNLPSFMKNTSKYRLLKQHILMRYCKQNKDKFDLFISSYNEMDLGKRCIQYIHFPSMNVEYGAKYNTLNNQWQYKDSFLRKVYLMVGKVISGYSDAKARENVTLVNSGWTGNVVEEIYGIKSTVLFPPVPSDFKNMPWEEKDSGFVCLSRIEPDKNVCEIIEILKRVRDSGLDVHIHIIGKTGSDSAYVERFEALRREYSSWVFFEGVLSREDLVKLASSHKFGIHGKLYEHFGIAVAELVKAGCIVFVNNNGGQVDIVGRDENLIYGSNSEAVDKIKKVLNNDDLQRNIGERLQAGAALYSAENFINQLQNIVEDFLGGIL